MSWNEIMDELIVSFNVDYENLRVLAGMLKACPECSVKRADVIEELDALAGMMIEIMARLRAMKAGEGAGDDE